MALDPGLAQRIRELLGERPGISERKMFGGLAFMADSDMFAGVLGNELIARISPLAHEAALARPQVRPMDFTGRQMKGYVYVGAEAIAEDAALAEWLAATLDFVRTLPAKG